MTKWDRLVAARKRLHLSQMEAAERVNVGIVTYQRWETGKAEPQPEHMRQLYGVFGALLASEAPEQKYLADISPTASATKGIPAELFIISSEEEIDEPLAFIASNMTAHLLFLAFMDHATCNDKRGAIRQAIEEHDSMNTDNKNYQITRREALCTLATLPIITLGLTNPGSSVPSTQYGKFLAQCTASLEACRELCKSSEASDLRLAFKSISQYLPILKSIVKESSTYRRNAASLTAQAYLLKHVLGLHVETPDVAIAKGYATQAVNYAAQSGDPVLHITALRNLTWAYNHVKNYQRALRTIEQAQHVIEHDTPLSSAVASTVYSTLAVIQAKNGVSPLSALDQAQKAFSTPPIDGYDLTSMDFDYARLMRDNGLAHYYQGRYNEALAAFAKVIDPDNLSAEAPMPARIRLELLNHQTMATLKSPVRDMERVITYWIAGVQGANALQSQQRFDEAYMAYEVMTGIWPDEQRIIDLRDLIIHW